MSAFARQVDVDTTIIHEAADWLVMMQSGEMGDEAQSAFMRWQTQSPAHISAWGRAEAMLQTFSDVPAQIGRSTLKQSINISRRKNLKILGIMCMAAPAIWALSRHGGLTEWTADYRTATGEQKTIDLEDGTRVVMNTASAINIAYTASVRNIVLLSGEILITTGKKHHGTDRPFTVTTPQGTARALGTRFTVREITDAQTRIDVFQGAVEISPVNSTQKWLVEQGGQMVYMASRADNTGAADAGNHFWEDGMLLAKSMRMDTLISELARYRKGVLRCDPAVADLIVSGAFPIGDTQKSLDLLRKTMPVSIRSRTAYWVIVGPIN